MFVKIHTPTTISGIGRVVSGQIIALCGRDALKLIRAGAASQRTVEPDTDEELEERKQRARQAGQNVDWHLDDPRRRPRALMAGVSAQGDESFAEQLKQATKDRAAKSPDHQQNSKERAEKERARYRKPQPRQPTKSS